MISIRRSSERGNANFGWLNSQHTFSFGNYYDAAHMGFSALRVINDDRVQAGAGFSTHGHKDMEIISYVLHGEIAHKDSEGNIATLPPGEFQLMSAGSGIRHSEYNPSATQALHFLQIWIQPNVQNQPPSYQQQAFSQQQGLTLVASPDARDGSMHIKQDALLYQLYLGPQQHTSLAAAKHRHYYVHLISGQLSLEGETLHAGDGAQLTQIEQLNLVAQGCEVQALVFDLP